MQQLKNVLQLLLLYLDKRQYPKALEFFEQQQLVQCARGLMPRHTAAAPLAAAAAGSQPDNSGPPAEWDTVQTPEGCASLKAATAAAAGPVLGIIAQALGASSQPVDPLVMVSAAYAAAALRDYPNSAGSVALIADQTHVLIWALAMKPPSPEPADAVKVVLEQEYSKSWDRN